MCTWFCVPLAKPEVARLYVAMCGREEAIEIGKHSRCIQHYSLTTCESYRLTDVSSYGVSEIEQMGLNETTFPSPRSLLIKCTGGASRACKMKEAGSERVILS